VTSGAFEADTVGSGNTNPPSITLLAYAAAQAGLVIAAESAATRLLARPRLWHRVQRLNATTMTVYLWHFVPVIVVAVAFYPVGMMPQPALGTARWWDCARRGSRCSPWCLCRWWRPSCGRSGR
jgi:hypothetical protein